MFLTGLKTAMNAVSAKLDKKIYKEYNINKNHGVLLSEELNKYPYHFSGKLEKLLNYIKIYVKLIAFVNMLSYLFLLKRKLIGVGIQKSDLSAGSGGTLLMLEVAFEFFPD